MMISLLLLGWSSTTDFLGELSELEGLVLSVDHDLESIKIVQVSSLGSYCILLGDRGLFKFFLQLVGFSGLPIEI